MSDENSIDRRKHPRLDFAYPAELRIFSENIDHLTFNGYVENMSMSGACIQLEDKYGRINNSMLPNAKIKITIHMPRKEKITLISLIKWARKARQSLFITRIGIEFENLTDWQSEAVSNLINMRNKDQNMMWNLWDQYERQL